MSLPKNVSLKDKYMSSFVPRKRKMTKEELEPLRQDSKRLRNKKKIQNK